MPKTLGDVMSANPVTLQSSATAAQAAQAMRDNAIGDVLVTENGALTGIVTDRDLVTRCIAEGADPETVSLSEICSRDPVTFLATDEVQGAVDTMRGNAVRRVPIVDEQGAPLGVVSLGDLAVELDGESALGEISAAAPNN